jgi:hypothetical protein
VPKGHIFRRLKTPSQGIINQVSSKLGHRKFVEMTDYSDDRVQEKSENRETKQNEY